MIPRSQKRRDYAAEIECLVTPELQVRVSVLGDESTWFQVPRRHDVVWIASGRIIPWYEIQWLPYLKTVRDLLLAGF